MLLGKLNRRTEISSGGERFSMPTRPTIADRPYLKAIQEKAEKDARDAIGAVRDKIMKDMKAALEKTTNEQDVPKGR